MWKCCLFIDSYIHHRLKRKIWQIKRQKWNKSGGSSTELTRAPQCWRMILFVVFIRWELKSCALKWSGSPGCAVFGTIGIIDSLHIQWNMSSLFCFNVYTTKTVCYWLTTRIPVLVCCRSSPEPGDPPYLGAIWLVQSDSPHFGFNSCIQTVAFFYLMTFVI